MSDRRGWRRLLLVSGLLGLVGLPGSASAQAPSAAVAGLLSELRLGGGSVEVRTQGADEWRPAAPLMSLLAGDTVRASGAASAVVLLSGARGTLKVDAATGPVIVVAPPGGETRLRKAQALLAASLGFLSTGAREVSQTVIGTRSVRRPPIVLGPRNGPALADSLSFEWVGARTSTYNVQVLAPGAPGVPRVLAEERAVPGAAWAYPSGAPRLEPGQRYVFRVATDDTSQPAQEAWFEVLTAERTKEVREALVLLEQEMGPKTPRNTLAALRAGYLADAGLYHEARRLLLGALAQDPEEPTLHLVLGNVYARSGLPRQANEAFDEARFLLRRRGE